MTWLNRDAIHHAATADDGLFDSRELNQGGRFMRTFQEAGDFSYHCAIHRTCAAPSASSRERARARRYKP